MIRKIFKYVVGGAVFVCLLLREIAQEWGEQGNAERSHDECDSALSAEYTAALLELGEGRAERMRNLAHQGVADAWVELAGWLDRQPLPDAATQATAAYGHAASAPKRVWKVEVGNTYDQRRLLGIGHEPDYAALAAEWRGDSRSYWNCAGHQREFELAWLYVHAPPPIHDPTEAYRFLCLGRARWGEDGRGWQLNESATALGELSTWLQGALDPAKREQIARDAKRQVYDEYVATK